MLTDLAFNMREGENWITELWLRLLGARGVFGPHRMMRRFVSQRERARQDVARILEWDFDRVIVSHGAVLQERGKRLMREAYRWIG